MSSNYLSTVKMTFTVPSSYQPHLNKVYILLSTANSNLRFQQLIKPLKCDKDTTTFRTDKEPDNKLHCRLYLKKKALQQFRIPCWVHGNIYESFTSLIQQILRYQLKDLGENDIQYNFKAVLSTLTVIMSSRTFSTFSLAWFFKLDIWLKVEKRFKWTPVSQSPHYSQI